MRALRWVWFVGFWLLLPWPLHLMGDAFVPAVRYWILGGVASAMAVVEGASGPVGGIVLLMLGMGALTTGACWIAAWGIAKLLGGLPIGVQRAISFGGLGAALVFCLICEPYQTPFGRAPTGGLLDVLW